MYYFAYGSNMNHREMLRKRCKGARFLGRAYLDSHKFVFDGYSEHWKGAVGNMVESPSHIVAGGLYEITEVHRDALDVFEGYPKGYDRRLFKVRDDEGRTFDAWAYLVEPRAVGKPSGSYRRVVTRGAKDCGLPSEYAKKYLEG